MKRCCLLKNPPWVSDGFEGFRAGCVCLHVMRQGFRVETPDFGSKRPLYIGSYVVLKYDEASKIMVPQIAWWGIHLIAGTSFWWIRHLLVRWWLGMILHSLKRIAGDQRDQKTCAPRCFVPCAKPVAMRRHWDHITDGARVFLLTDSLGEAKHGKTVMTHDKTSTYLMFLIFRQPTDFFMFKVFLFWLQSNISFSSLPEDD